ERLSKVALRFACAGAQAWATAIGAWRSLRHERTPAYRPEAHYMRGPGPKWRAKHAGMATER
ncbi:MAG TPA: hypothetical protein VEK73_19820, partial [Xanthobacteraceae bacterium]|nr:hypothetical protein [Xanthobacteraceae bacterium]